MIKKHKCILIVDDSKDIRESLALILEDEGYITLQASNGLDAMKLMTDCQIDLLITDILMPQMDGIELSTKARKQFPELEIILMSGGGRQITNKNEYDYLGLTKHLTGINHLLKKPFQPLEMITLVDQLIKK